MTSTHLHIRPARPDDRQAVIEMVATVWDGADYIPHVWDEWLAADNGPLLIGELEQRPVAVAKLSALSPGEDWFEGLRIAPEQRGKGFARAMLRRCVELAHERRSRTLRYMTGADNPAMHRIGDELGFRLVYAPVWYRGHPLDDGPQPVALGPERFDALLEDLERSALLAHTGGLYSYDWCTFDLSEERLREHLRRDEVLAMAGGDAWAIVIPNPWGGVWLAHIEGTEASMERLGAAIRARLQPGEGSTARALLPPDVQHVHALVAAGFVDEGHQMHVYELRI